jgi:hypothetical protein
MRVWVERKDESRKGREGKGREGKGRTANERQSSSLRVHRHPYIALLVFGRGDQTHVCLELIHRLGHISEII